MQLLVRTVDKVSPDKGKNTQLTKRGDVIVVQPDGATWGLAELLNVQWLIVSVPDMPDVQAKALLSSETPPLAKPDMPVQPRMFRLNLDALGLAVLDKNGNPPPRMATFDKDQLVVPDVVKVSAEVLAVKEIKPVSTDAVAVGDAGVSIGPR